MPDGNRKSSKIKALKNLNNQYSLGLTDRYIENLSVSQLKRKLYQIRIEHHLSIHKNTKIPKGITA